MKKLVVILFCCCSVLTVEAELGTDDVENDGLTV